jgi:G3E family GTPase
MSRRRSANAHESGAAPAKSIPIVLLTGYLGSGKSTFLDATLHDASQRRENAPRICVVLNEFAEHGIGIENEIEHARCAVARVELFETASGCLCCGGRDDFVQILRDLVPHRARFDVVVLEANGLADPSFLHVLFTDPSLAAFRLASVVAMVDAQRIGAHLDAPRTADNGSGLQIVNEALEQLLVADRIVLNKIDLVPPAELGALEARVRKLNPQASVVRATFGRSSASATLALDVVDIARTGDITAERLTAVDPQFLEFRPFRAHNEDIGAVSFECEPVSRERFERWLTAIVAANSARLLRYKAVLATPAADGERLILQGFRDSWSLRASPRRFASDEPRIGVVSLIGLALDGDAIAREFTAATGVKCWLMRVSATPRQPLAVVLVRMAGIVAVIAALAQPEWLANALDALVPGASAVIAANQWLALIVGAVLWFALQAVLARGSSAPPEQ